MFGFEYGAIDPHDSVLTRAIKVLFRMQLPLLRPLIEKRVRDRFEQEISNGAEIQGKSVLLTNYLIFHNNTCLGWISLSTIKFTKAVIEEVNAQIILGEELGKYRDALLPV